MTKFSSTIIFTLAVCSLSLLAFPAVGLMAGDNLLLAKLEKIEDAETKFGIAKGESVGQIKLTVNRVINIVLGLVGIIAIAIMIYGGFQYITAAGDEGQAESAKRTILYAVIGLIVIGLAAVITNFVINAVRGSSASIPVAYAAESGGGFGPVTEVPTGLAQGSLTGNLIKIINAFLILVSIVAVIVMIYGGIQYVTARGDEGQAETAKRTILYAVIGLIVIGLSAAAVNFVISAVR